MGTVGRGLSNNHALMTRRTRLLYYSALRKERCGRPPKEYFIENSMEVGIVKT